MKANKEVLRKKYRKFLKTLSQEERSKMTFSYWKEIQKCKKTTK